MSIHQGLSKAQQLDEAVGGVSDGPDLAPVARRYTQGRYRRASVMPGPGEALVLQRDAAEWRQIAILRWSLILDLITERDKLRADLAAKN